MFGGVYSGRSVLVTGHTGFKGGWLSAWLELLGARVTGLALPPQPGPSLFEIVSGTCAASRIGDVRDAGAVRDAVNAARPEIVFHLAAQALVLESYADPVGTLETNIVGTANVLEAVRALRTPVAVVVVTSDKCYENRGWEFGYRETDRLGGADPYSMSKAAAELVVATWRRSFFSRDAAGVRVASGRAGNVIGGGDYALHRIVPDCVRHLADGQPVPVRNPVATRIWQHVLESAGGYLALGAALLSGNQRAEAAFNFAGGSDAHRTVGDLVRAVLSHWPGEWRDGSDPNALPEAGTLNLAIDRARAILGWKPVWDFERSVAETIAWYRARHEGRGEMLGLTRRQIEHYAADARAQGGLWAT